MQMFVNVLRGVAIGLANIIPGVSGGTMALVLGIYERLIKAVHNIGPQLVKALFRGRKALMEELRRIDALFLASIAVGALAAVVATAKLLTYLLQNRHDPTYGFFFGLVIVSLWVPYRLIKKGTLGTVIAALLAVGLVVGLTNSMSGEQQLESARKKAAIKAAKDKGEEAAQTGTTVPKVPSDPKTMVLFLVAGTVAISAMVLPGISGSFVLLLMGLYFDVLTCIVARQFVLLGIFALGCLIGLLLVTRLINFMLERYHDLTMAFLLGLVLGSLYAIWPFKAFEVVAGRRVDLHNIVPSSLRGNELLTLATAMAGCAVVGVFIWLEGRQPRVPNPTAQQSSPLSDFRIEQSEATLGPNRGEKGRS